MGAVNFTVWDAPRFGQPRTDCLSTHWTDGRMVTVSIGRSVSGESQDPPDITIASMDSSVADESRQGLTLGPLFLFTKRLADAQGIDHEEAARVLVGLSEQSGTPTTLIVEGSQIAAHLHEIPVTRDWAVTTLDANVAVCVAGRREIAIPQLGKADMNVWEGPLLEQIDDMKRNWRRRDPVRR